MNILDMIMSPAGGAAISRIARQLGVGEDDVRSAAGQMVPALSRGLANNAGKDNGLDGLLAALKTGEHSRYIENPDLLGQNESVEDGNNILGHIFGSKDVSRSVANHAANNTGLDSSILKKMLPLLATLVMGSLGKQAGRSGMLGSNQGSGVMNMLTRFLDSDKDGSMLDDLLGMAKKFF